MIERDRFGRQVPFFQIMLQARRDDGGALFSRRARGAWTATRLYSLFDSRRAPVREVARNVSVDRSHWTPCHLKTGCVDGSIRAIAFNLGLPHRGLETGLGRRKGAGRVVHCNGAYGHA